MRVGPIALALAAVAAPLAAALLAGCGSDTSQLVVSVGLSHAGGATSVKPGDTADYTVRVVNKGPGSASGVTVRVDLPTTMRYKNTVSLSNERSGAVRIQPQDPATRSQSPAWGTWLVSAPVTQADGTVRRSEVDVAFAVTVDGAPGEYQLVPHVFSDSVDGEVVGAGFKVTVDPASRLDVSVSVEAPTVKPGQTITYKVNVLNAGSGAAEGVNILLSLPQGLTWVRTDMIKGNSSRGTPVDPTAGSILVYYGGWAIPAASAVGPGQLTITFVARAQTGVVGGRFPITGQVTDSSGAILPIGETAQVTVDAPTPAPTPPPTASPHP